MTENVTQPLDANPAASQAAATIYLVSQSIDRLTEGRRLASAVVATCEADRSKAVRGIHPDILELSPPEGKERIGIGQVREVIRSAQFAPTQSKCKVCLIAKAEGLTIEAANALLKILEEPPRGLQFILLAEHPSDLLPTIVSRSRLVRMPIASVTTTVNQLVAASYDEVHAQWLSRLLLRDGELDALLATPIDVAPRMAKAATELARAEIDVVIDAAMKGDPIERRQALLTVMTRATAWDGDLLTLGIRLLATQTREALGIFLHDLLAVTFDLVRTANIPDTLSDPLAKQVQTMMGVDRLHKFCFSLDDAHRSLAVYGPVEGILLSLFLASKGATDGT